MGALLRRRLLPPQCPRFGRGFAEAGLWPERLKPPGDPGGWGVRVFDLDLWRVGGHRLLFAAAPFAVSMPAVWAGPYPGYNQRRASYLSALQAERVLRSGPCG